MNKIRQIVYSLYQSKQISKKVYNNITKSIQIWKWILYLWTLKTVKLVWIAEQHVLQLKLTDKLDLRRGENSIALSNASIYYTWKNIKTHTITINLTITPTRNDKFKSPDGSY